MDTILLSTMFVVFLGCFTQTLTGFGLALVTMALLPPLIGLHVATPLVALVAITLELVMLVRYHEALNIRSILGLTISALIAIPIGVVYVRQIDERIALFLLGVVITGYALYALTGFRLPALGNSMWAWIFGFLGGLLGGAYNTSGPPAVIYGNCRQWSPQEFKSNLAGYFMVGSIMVVATHALNGNFTPDVWLNFWRTLPALILGFVIGQSTDKWLKPETFRRIVLMMLVILGLRLMI